MSCALYCLRCSVVSFDLLGTSVAGVGSWTLGVKGFFRDGFYIDSPESLAFGQSISLLGRGFFVLSACQTLSVSKNIYSVDRNGGQNEGDYMEKSAENK